MGKPVKEMSDEDVFGSLEPSEMSDSQVFGRQTPKEMSVRGTYLPFKREGGEVSLAVPGVIKSMQEAVEAPGQALRGSGGDYLPGRHPGEAEAANVALNAIGLMRSPGGRMGRPGPLERARTRLSEEKALAAEMDQTIAAGRGEGLVSYPDTVVGKTALHLGGKTPMRAAIRERNQAQYDRMSREEASLGPTDRLTPEVLEAKRTELSAPYRELGKMSPAANKLWKEVQDIRIASKKAWAGAQTNADREAARALDQLALEKEVQIDKIAQMNFKPDQLNKLRDARKALAKNFAVDEAVIPGTGHVDPGVYQKAINDRRLLRGKLELMGKFKNAEEFAMEKMKEEGGMLHGAVGGHAMKMGGGLYYPGIPFLGKYSRALALSNIGQRAPRYEPGLGVKLGDIASKVGPYAYPRPTEE